MKLATPAILTTAAIGAVLLTPTANAQVQLQLVTQIDTSLDTGLGIGDVGSVAAHGGNVFAANLFPGAEVFRITDPFGAPGATPISAPLVAPAPPAVDTTNGFVSLSTDGVTLVAATNNGGADPDQLQSIDVATDTVNFTIDSATLDAPIAGGGNRFDGAAVDPISGNIFVTAFGAGFPAILDPVTGADASDGPTSLFTSGTGTGFRDVSFDDATGDIFLRAVNGVARGLRDGPDDFDQPDGGGAGVDAIVNVADGFNSAINAEFLPAGFAGQELVILNVRNNADTFDDQVVVFAADAVDTPVAVDFLAADGSPFTTSAAGSGIYDFSFDPINNLLYLSDFSANTISVFAFVPEPSSLGLVVALASVAGLRRRRG